jgi:protein-tyrosine phosphatase
MGFVDLHSHVLPALDDGAQALSQSVELCRLLQQMGFEIVCATPHQKVGAFVPSAEAIFSAHQALTDALAEQALHIDLRLGAENFWDELFLERIRSRTQPTYTGDRAFLFEIHPRMAPPRLEETLFQIRLGGLLPVMAHPERYAALREDRERLRAVGRTAALVVDLGALAGAHGALEQKASHRLLEERLVHAVTTDVHSAADLQAAGAGMNFIRKRYGEADLIRLLDENPRRILAGELPD